MDIKTTLVGEFVEEAIKSGWRFYAYSFKKEKDTIVLMNPGENILLSSSRNVEGGWKEIFGVGKSIGVDTQVFKLFSIFEDIFRRYTLRISLTQVKTGLPSLAITTNSDGKDMGIYFYIAPVVIKKMNRKKAKKTLGKTPVKGKKETSFKKTDTPLISRGVWIFCILVGLFSGICFWSVGHSIMDFCVGFVIGIPTGLLSYFIAL